MRRRDLLSALGVAPVVLALPVSAAASEEPASGVALEMVPPVQVFRQNERVDLTLHAVPRGRAPIREVTFSVLWSSGLVLVGPDRRPPVNPAEGEYRAELLVPPGALTGRYFVRWRVETEDGQVAEVDHAFWVAPSCSGDFTIVKTGEDDRGAFIFSFKCDGCGSVSPPAFAGEMSRECAEWRKRHCG